MTIAAYTPRPPELELSSRHRWVALLGEATQLAHAIANTNFVPKGLRGDEAAITAAILYGDEVGLPPMQALAKIAVIDGKPAIAAEAQRALIIAAGHTLWFEDFTSTKVTWCGRRADTGVEQRITWTLDDARKARLAAKDNWVKYPRAMLSARASGDLARAVFADVIGGLAAAEELEDAAGPAADEPEPAPPTAPSRRRRATRTTPAVTVAPPAPEPAGPALPDETTETAEPAADAQRRKLFALFNEHDITDRLERLAWVNERLDRIVTSSLELTDAEASRLIDELDAAPAAPEQAALDLADPADAILDVTPERLDIVQHLRREAGVSDAWLKDKLNTFGIKNVSSRVTKADLARLSQAHARQLSDELASIVDQRAE